MGFDYGLALVLSALIAGYLVYALVRPERF
jgi:K+-transporting ATPase KdpF subunit